MKYSAVLFDLDGTLIDSLEDLADSANEVLEKYGYNTHTIATYKKLIGRGGRNLIRKALPSGTQEKVITEVLEDYRKIYGRNYLNKTKPYSGIFEMLEVLKLTNIKMGICSNKPHKHTNEIVDKLLGRKYFSAVLGEREGVPQKPHPASLLEAAELLKVNPIETIYLGDSGIDMESAYMAGMLAAGATWGFSDKEELEKFGAKVFVTTPFELIAFIKLHHGKQ